MYLDMNKIIVFVKKLSKNKACNLKSISMCFKCLKNQNNLDL